MDRMKATATSFSPMRGSRRTPTITGGASCRRIQQQVLDLADFVVRRIVHALLTIGDRPGLGRQAGQDLAGVTDVVVRGAACALASGAASASRTTE